MIAVIADDLSGATELASAASEAGFSAEVQIGAFHSDCSADLIAVSTETRHLHPDPEKVSKIAREIFAANPSWVFKKTDSILRGHVAAEIAAILVQSELDNCLLIPANPQKGRIISQGAYFIDGSPLHLTPFADDPEFPRLSCDVVALARGNLAEILPHTPVFWIGEAPVPEHPGIFLPESANLEQLKSRAQNLCLGTTLPAGGVEFFEAILGKLANNPTNMDFKPCPGSLYICGSYNAWLQGREKDFAALGIPVKTMPTALLENPRLAPAMWQIAISEAFGTSKAVAIAIGRGEKGRDPSSLLLPLASVTSKLIHDGTVSRLFIEGGATASAVIQQCGWKRLRVRPTTSKGIAQLEPISEIPCLIHVKPGNYPWPHFPNRTPSS